MKDCYCDDCGDVELDCNVEMVFFLFCEGYEKIYIEEICLYDCN